MLGNRFDEHRRFRDMFSEHVDGRLTPASERRLEQHLATCESCRQLLEDLRATVDLLQTLPDQEPPRSFAITPAVQRAPISSRWGLPSIAMRLATATAALALAVTALVDIGGLAGPEEDALNGTKLAGRGEEAAMMAPQAGLASPADAKALEAVPAAGSRENKGVDQSDSQLGSSPPSIVPNTRDGMGFSDPVPTQAAGSVSQEANQTGSGGEGTLRWIEVILGAALGLLVLGNVLVFFGRRISASQ